MRCISLPYPLRRHAEAKLAADLAAAAHEETLQHLRDKAAATSTLKHKEFKTAIANVADTHAARAAEIQSMFDEMGARYANTHTAWVWRCQ